LCVAPVPASCPIFPWMAPPTTATSTLSLHDALPIYLRGGRGAAGSQGRRRTLTSHRLPVPLPAMSRESTFIMVKLDGVRRGLIGDRKSTRLNSSHVKISYAVFCLKKKNSTRVEPPDA